MRLVEFNDLTPGMEIADNFYGETGSILAKKGSVISEKYISNLSQYEIPYLYVLDEFSSDIQVNCSITSETRNSATQNLRKLYESVQKKQKKKYSENLKACLESIDHLVEDVIAEKIDLYDVFDIKMIENYRYQQPVNVTVISLIIGKALKMSHQELYHLAIGAMFHDIGYMFISEEILTKSGKLTQEEFGTIKGHARAGYEFAKNEFNLPLRSYLAILQHHERYDGTGYPMGKQKDQISIQGRIVAIADVFDALSSKRRQRKALKPAQAFKEIIENGGKAFDPQLIRLFAEHVSPYPIGFTLKLPDDRVGIVVKNYRGKPFNPTLRIIKENGENIVPYTITL